MGLASRNPSISCRLAHGCKHRRCPARADSSREFWPAISSGEFARLGALSAICLCKPFTRVLGRDLEWGGLHVWTSFRPSVCASLSCEFAAAGSCARFARLGALRPPCSCGSLTRVLASDLKWGVCTFGRPSGHLFVRIPHASSGRRSQVRSSHVWARFSHLFVRIPHASLPTPARLCFSYVIGVQGASVAGWSRRCCIDFQFFARVDNLWTCFYSGWRHRQGVC